MVDRGVIVSGKALAAASAGGTVDQTEVGAALARPTTVLLDTIDRGPGTESRTTPRPPLARSTAPVRVRFSPDIFRTQAHGGVSRYIAELHRGLLESGADSRILAGLHVNAHLRDLPATFGIDVGRLRPTRVRQGLTKVADRLLERAWAPRQDAGMIYHKTYFDRTVPAGPRLAVTVYDMIHERYPEQFGGRDVTLAAKRPWCEAADVVFAISATTRDDVLERFGLPEEKVVVTPLGVTVADPRPGAVPFAGDPFVLYVGDRATPYKNWLRVLDAVTALGPDARLVCFGRPPSSADVAAVALRGIAGRVAFVGGDDHDLARCYQAAALLVYPSLFEGFGLPPLEAMAHGCPVVAARAGAVPEVTGDAALLVDPTDTDGIADAIGAVLRGGAGVDDRRIAGRARAAQHTWSATVRDTLAGYCQALER
ncbi:MAG: glycosyl transferase family 1 [Acidimicrobiales bacterium]|nr:glycosyl transferase family 1 [Acidimicrobiales bacterium]